VKIIFTLILLGLSVGLGNFAASIAIGLSGVNRAIRTKVALVFGLFETGMPIVGLLAGRQLAGVLGNHANIVGGGLLVLTGLYEIRSSLANSDKKDVGSTAKAWRKLLLAGLALSIDNLIIGFSLGAYKSPILLSVVVIGSSSVALSLVGLELGKRIGSRFEKYSEVFSGLILLLVGIAIGLKLF
jgi:putative Mn2+ efflux pump MntP